MTIQLIAAYARCAVFELDCSTCCFSPDHYQVFLNGDPVLQGDRNAFSLFDLLPEHSYRVRVEMGRESASLVFQTKEERACLNVLAFGAAEEKEDCTAFLQAALNACPVNGTVFVPRGVYHTGPLFMRSNTTLYLEEGAVLKGHTQREKYPILPGMIQPGPAEYNLGTWEGNPLDCFASLITAVGEENVCVCGNGVLDGNADKSDWWEDAKVRRGAWRPRTVFFKGCTGVSLVGLKVRNSPSWTIHPYYCDKVDILAVEVYNPDTSPNTDGINPECCQQVRIIGATVSVGDDCISIKSGKYYMATHHPRAAQDIEVRNCLLDRGHGAVVVGSEISAGVRDVRITKCFMRNTDRGLRVKTRRGRGRSSVVENVVYENVVMDGVLAPFVINMFYFCDPDGKSNYVSSKEPLPIDEMTPAVNSLTVHNSRCTGAQQVAAFFYGLPEQPIGLVEMKDVFISFAPDARPGQPAMMEGIGAMVKTGIYAANVKKLRLHNVTLKGYEGDRLCLHQVKNLEEE